MISGSTISGIEISGFSAPLGAFSAYAIVTPVVEYSGGSFYEEFNRSYNDRIRRRKEIEKQKKYDENIQNDIDRSIAQLLREQEINDDNRKEIDRLSVLVSKAQYIKGDFSERNQALLEEAARKKTLAALEIFERELAKQLEEEEFAVLMLLLN